MTEVVDKPNRHRRWVTLVVAGLLGLAACSGGGDEAADDGAASKSPAADDAATTTLPPDTPGPLTGLATPNAGRPALVVKIDNAPAARPQAGLDKADVVFEEMVEGGEVRFMAVFQSQDAGSVGPIRSVRPVDPEVISALGGLFAYSGGAPQFTALIRKAPVTLVGVDELGSAYTKRRDRKAPHNTYSDTAKLYAGAKSDTKAPPVLFVRLAEGQAFAPLGVAPATHLTANITGRVKADWDFDAAANLWRRGTNGTPHVVEGGNQLGFTNVITQFVTYKNTSSRDAAGNPVPTAEVIGSGKAIVLSGPNVVEARWSKASATAVTEYTDTAGAPLALTPGASWVTFAPNGATTAAR